MRNHITIFILAMFVAGATLRAQPTATNAPPTGGDKIVARVGNSVIQRRELDMALAGVLIQIQQRGQTVTVSQRQQLEYNVLNGLIERQVVLQAAMTNPPAGLDEKAKAQLDRARAAAGGEEPLLKSLEAAGISREEFERRNRENVLVAESLRSVAEAQVQIPPEDLKTFYDTNKARMKQPEMARASHILVRVDPSAAEDIKKASRAKINAARSLVIGGEKFAEIARKVSDDPQNARNGGDLGYFARGAMVPEFDKAAFSLPTNQVSEVITTQFGYHVLIVTDRRPAKQLTFDEAKADIERFLRSRKGNDVVREYVKGLLAKAKVEILLPPLPAPATNAPPRAAAPTP